MIQDERRKYDESNNFYIILAHDFEFFYLVNVKIEQRWIEEGVTKFAEPLQVRSLSANVFQGVSFGIALP